MVANNARAVASALIPVANVQALAEACNGVDGQVPERYLVAEAEEVIAGGGGSHSEIPVVDLRKLLDTRSSEECAKLKSACHHWGFFQLINHGMPDDVIGNLMRDVAEFFDLPLEAKKEWAQRPDSVQGYGQAFVVSEDQKLDWADMLHLQLQPTDRVLGLSPHTDASGLTLLLQMNNDVQGLQVKKDGRWFAVDAVDAAFIVKVGDVLEIMSNGEFRSVEHRAVIHPNKERISVAMFHCPSLNLKLFPLPEFVKKGEKVRYRSTSYEDFLKQYFSAKLDGRARLERLKLE
ncbi:unnamed protein product [Miscanthus lutarioriparius]|uniref:Fe2OG dioxygenase domain-containing protein n=1 Tax=Miscanthus lutarioriparius TaxID=422564 RepID=A0A811MWA1_9POAL|nr:unnamed protein product [Miscanthus lutarioriparius]